MRSAWIWLPMLTLLGGCNWVNNVTGLTKEANKAVGAACRQTGRSLEECYLRNPDADKAALYSGWREMHEYMEKHKLQTMVPPAEASLPASAVGKSDKPAEGGMGESKPASSRLGPIIQPPLTDEAADQAAQHDPQVEAVLATVNAKQKGLSSAPAAPSADEKEQKKLLDLIKQLDQKAPASKS